MDVVIPIVFPDYRITVEVQKIEVDVFPWTTFDDFHIPAYRDKISNLGHAGVLFINGKTGTTKYYEYGRYDPPKNLGLVVKARNLPDAVLKNGKIEFASLKNHNRSSQGFLVNRDEFRACISKWKTNTM